MQIRKEQNLSFRQFASFKKKKKKGLMDVFGFNIFLDTYLTDSCHPQLSLKIVFHAIPLHKHYVGAAL